MPPDKIAETLSRQRSAAKKFLIDTVGCLIVDKSLPHVVQAIADDIEMVYSSADRRPVVTVNTYDLTHVLAEWQFRYQGKGDFPVVLLRFKLRMLPAGEDMQVFREDEYLMRAGIVLQLQSDNTRARIESEPKSNAPALVMDYTEERLVLTVGETSLAEPASRFMVGVNLAAGTIFGNFGLNFG